MMQLVPNAQLPDPESLLLISCLPDFGFSMRLVPGSSLSWVESSDTWGKVGTVHGSGEELETMSRRGTWPFSLPEIDMSNFESSLGDETLPQDKEMPELEAGDAPLLTGEDWSSGSEGAPEEEGALESVSALNELDKNLQCPKEEDTVKLVGSPACKTCRFLLVRRAFSFNQAEVSGLWLWPRPQWGLAGDASSLCVPDNFLHGGPRRCQQGLRSADEMGARGEGRVETERAF